MKYFVQNYQVINDNRHWDRRWRYRFEIFDFENYNRIFFRPDEDITREVMADEEHLDYINKIIQYR